MSSIVSAVVPLLLASFAWAQPVSERVFSFRQTEATQHFQEIATVIRSMTEVRDLQVDAERRTLAIRGNADQLALGEWLFHQLDAAPAAPAHASAPEFRTSPVDESVTRVFHVASDRSLRQLQEMATVVRTVSEIRRLFTYSRLNAIVIRGSTAQSALAEWLIRELDQRADPGRHYSVLYPYQEPGAAPDYVRVYYPAQATSERNVQEMATLIRSIGDIRRLFTLTSPRAIVTRGTSGQLALAAWMLDELNAVKPPRPESAPYTYSEGGTLEDVVRVFYLKDAETPARLQESATEIRKATGIRRLFTYMEPRAVAVRGTAAQVAHAEQLVKAQGR